MCVVVVFDRVSTSLVIMLSNVGFLLLSDTPWLARLPQVDES